MLPGLRLNVGSLAHKILLSILNIVQTYPVAKSDPNGESASATLPRIHALLANVALERSRIAPKYIFPGASSSTILALLNISLPTYLIGLFRVLRE
jgi:hypothetical protein